jgi:hypothetical protein
MLTQDCVRELFDYDPETGIVTRRVSRWPERWPVGGIVGTARADGYLMTQIGATGYLLHRIIFLWMTGRMPLAVDHANMCRTDNRWQNIREATRSQNGANRRAISTNTSGYKGVSYHKRVGKYQARIYVEGKCIALGYRDTALEAAELYNAASAHHFGEFSRS